MTKYIIVTGNPVDGLEFIGPFDTDTEACEFGNGDAYMADHGGDWWVSSMEAPSTPTEV